MEENLYKLRDELSLESENQIAISLDYLSILSYSISKRNDILFSIEDIIIKNMGYFSSRFLPKYLKSKIFLFYGFYLDCLFTEPQKTEIYYTALEDLISGQIYDSKSVEYQAWDSLSELVFNEDFNNRHIGDFERILLLFLEDLNKKINENYFEALEHVFSLYCMDSLLEKNLEILNFGFEEIIKIICQTKNEEVLKIGLRIISDNFNEEKIKILKLNSGVIFNLVVLAFRCEKSGVFKFVDEGLIDFLTKILNLQSNEEIFKEIVGNYLNRYQNIDKCLVLYINNYLYYNYQDLNSSESLGMVIFFKN